jgi:hypothetical protein
MSNLPSDPARAGRSAFIKEDAAMKLVPHIELLNDDVRRRLPALYATEHDADPIAQVKFFATFADWTWYATEFDGEDLFFGLVFGFVAELGYFSLAELGSGAGSLTQVERDLYFTPKPLSEVRRLHEQNGAA